MRRLPPLSGIEAFVQVARTGSVKAAAESLLLSAPALSRRIQGLERQLARPLFDRVHQGILLNAEGEALLHRIAPALDAMIDAIDATVGGAEIMRLRIGMPPLFASQQIIHRLPDLRELHPTLHLDIDTAPHGMARVGEGLDAAIVLVRSVDPSLYGRRIGVNYVVALASPELINGPHPIKTPKDLRHHTILLHRDMPETFDEWRDAMGHPEVEPAAIDHMDSGQLMLEAAAQGLGIAFMLDSHLSEWDDADRLVPLFTKKIASPYNYYFTCRRSAMSVRAVRLFHDWLFDALEQSTANDKNPDA
jgi:LysR family glycine cleavage system transcriptional activator